MSELCGSLATVQMIAGNNKEARRNINASLRSPNDNTVAQAVWMAQQYQISINTQNEWFNDPFSSEARFYKYDSYGDFENALMAAQEWMLDEPFSSHPAIASVYSASILEKYQEAEKFARTALTLHHDNSILKGNLVYALASQNKFEEAEKTLLETINIEKQQSNNISPQSMANLGMLMYRFGEFIEGEQMYRHAIETYIKGFDSTRKAIALKCSDSFYLYRIRFGMASQITVQP